jgi:hypothetical protein
MGVPSYILKNITGRDANLGDLRVKIPAGKCRNLLAKKSRVTIEDIVRSEESGSIYKFLKRKVLIKVYKEEEVVLPLMELADPSAVTFPQRRKSSIVIEVGDIDEEIKDLVLSEDEEYLKQLEIESKAAEGEMGLPVIAPERKE